MNLKTVGALGIVYVVWGSTYLAIRYAIEGFPPLLSAALRFLAAAVLMLGYLAARRPAALRATRIQLSTAAVSGILLLAGGNGLVTVAEQRVQSGLVALIIACVPLWIVILRLLLRDRPGPATALGVLIGLAGVAIIFLPGGSGEVDLGFAALAVLAALSWAIGSLLVTLRPVPADPLTLTTVEMAAGGLVLLVGAAARGEFARFAPGEAPASAWFALSYLVVFGSLIAFTAYVWLLGNAPVSIVSTYAYVNPAVAVLLGALIAGERLTGSALAGGLVILAAVALVVTAESRVRRRAAEPAKVS
ncbi:MAG TPA: EamA family transporter [Mycobacteriales bacterium]|nr:EamA family transporter [Mycobacteriales bacterium]